MINKVSIITPLYNEQGNIARLAEEISQSLEKLDYHYEVIMVNDGSSDDTWQQIQEISKKDGRFRGIDLAGNYGQTLALRAGFEHSSGDLVIFMDGDLQHNPADIPRFIEKIEEGYDMVGGSKTKRPEKIFRRNMSRFAHLIIQWISGVKMSYFGATFRAYRRYLLENANMLGDAHRFMGATLARKGVKHTEIPLQIRKRTAGKSHYSLRKVFLVIIDLIFLKFTVSYMNKPFRLFGLTGGVMFLLGSVPSAIFILSSIFFETNIREDYLSEFMFSFFIMIIGLILVSFGLIAEIGVYNYYSRGSHNPYTIRRTVDKNETDE